ncbi:MAG: hypothetical protein A2541_02575 [Candidatus Taylorbacteria bacterium RIFOXYD2_FULL_36_9]|uniref:Uncharacterized protein n=1 Tax=Candidatus Taylorbacteria bacterium RIFOXYD2_FULL_36_9 TaxID=1802338 RepID=A0A1G2PET8_9BACT|nr:MAG: hypothetical protein A2541_02575 [Candidatus Taylorbacteria bacterium RIFOXYD2_FULL_36_9]
MLKYTAENMTRNKKQNKEKNETGFTLIEILIGTAVFMIIAVSVYQTYATVLNAISNSQAKITITALANEQFEIIRNLSYSNVGTINGVPNGKIPSTQNLVRDGKNFTVKTFIRSLDDPFDGSVSSSTNNDLSPADYKVAELEISCDNCKNFPPAFFTTNIGPRDLESESTNGSLFVRVFDINAQPLPDANIHITNNDVFPSLQIDDTTNKDGLLQIVDAPPAVNSYYITVSKPGYSIEKTYKMGEPENPNPIDPNATVVVRQLTQISFFLNYVSDFTIFSQDENCNPLPEINFTLQGTKLIGTEPDILKYNASSTTDNSGQKIIEDLDWGTYTLTSENLTYAKLGIATSTVIILNASSSLDFKLILAPKNSDSLLLTVKDNAGLPISGANVELTQTASSTISVNEVTGPGLAICRPEGQALFTNLIPENYNLTVSKSGYQNYTETLNLGSVWQEKEIILNP